MKKRSTRAAAVCGAILLLGPAASAGERVNVALAEWGATATASSEYGPDYRAGNVLDGRWAKRETDKWNSAANKVPHWLKIDLGRARTIDRIVVRHEGGARGDKCTTADFRLERSDRPDGPWVDLCGGGLLARQGPQALGARHNAGREAGARREGGEARYRRARARRGVSRP
ncbi:MAG: discoidin domain-containing protein [Planctomycetota bacterium]